MQPTDFRGSYHQIQRHDGQPGDMTDIYRGLATVVQSLSPSQYERQGGTLDHHGFPMPGWVWVWFPICTEAEETA